MATEPRQRLTIQEYLAFERQSEAKHDFLGGEMFAMTGASLEHNRITINISSSLYALLAEGSCEVFSADMRVKTRTDLFTYPDVIVVCGEPRFGDAELDTLLNPTLVVEVLSKSTETYDRLTKLEHYRTIPELSEIVFVAQSRVRIEHWRRQPDGRWLLEELEDLGQPLELPSLGCSLPLTAIYRRVFEAPS